MNFDELDDIAAGTDTHDVVTNALAVQLEHLRQDPRHEFFTEWTDDEITRAIATLEADQARAAAHTPMHAGVVDADVPPLCAECQEPRPCSTILELRRVYL